MAELLKELKRGQASFSMIGTVKISPETFKGVKQPKEGGYWASVRTSLPIEIEEGVVLFPEISDGYMTNNPIIKKFSADREEGMIDIPFKERNNESYLEKVPVYEFYRTNIEDDENGKPLAKEFLHGIDFEKYLKEHLKNGANVRINGSVEYGFDKDRSKVYRNYKIKNVYRNEGYEKNGEQVPPIPNSGTLNQTYLVDASSLDERWEKDLTSKGKTAINLNVPVYMSKVFNGQSYVEFKQTVPMPQQVVVTADPSNEDVLEKTKKMTTKLFEVGKRKVREIALTVKINEGSETVVGDIEVDDDLKSLLDAGLISMEEIKKQVTVRGNRVSELIFVRPRVLLEEGKAVVDMDDEKYHIDALLFPTIEEVEAKKEEKKEKSVSEDPAEPIADDLFDELFA